MTTRRLPALVVAQVHRLVYGDLADVNLRPLRLFDEAARDHPRPSTAVYRPARTVNLSASPLGAPVGGLGAVVVSVLITMIAPEAWWFLLLAVPSGLLLGAALILVTRHRVLSSAGGRSAKALFPIDSPTGGNPDAPGA